MKTTTISNNKNLFVASLNAVPACQLRDGEADWFPAVDVTDTGQEYVFDVDLPGLKPEEIQLRLRSDELSISGQRVARHKGGKRLRVERPSGAFVRRLPLPPDACGEIRATFGEGILELRVLRAGPDTEPVKAELVARKPEETVV
jgi:HSP20 family protein